MSEKDQGPSFTDPLTGDPIIHPADAVETRTTMPGEVGYTPESVSVTGLAKDVNSRQKSIGDTDRVGGPAVIGSPDRTRGYETPRTGEGIDLSGDVLYRRSNGDIVEAKAIKSQAASDVAYIVLYKVQGNTMKRIFKEGELEAMQSDIAERLERGEETITRTKERASTVIENESTLPANEDIVSHVPGMSAFVDTTPQRDTIPLEDFRGDPTRVIGHPSNPTNTIMQAYADSLRPHPEEPATDLVSPPLPEQESPDPFEQLPQSVQDEVLDYRRAVRNKYEAERDKRFAQVAEDDRLIHKLKQSLSPEAKQFLGLQ